MGSCAEPGLDPFANSAVSASVNSEKEMRWRVDLRAALLFCASKPLIELQHRQQQHSL